MSQYTYPQFMYQTPYLYPYQPVQVSPFIPPSLLPPSPNGGSGTRRVRFEEDDRYPNTRLRPPSWHGPAAVQNPAPFPSPPFVYSPLPPVMPIAGPPSGYIPHRRLSDSSVRAPPSWVGVPTWMVYPHPQVSAPPPAQFHPLLNGESAQEILLFFDLSLHAFNPIRISRPRETSGSSIGQDELRQQATHPGVNRMRITCDMLPDWPVVLEPQRDDPYRSDYLGVPSSSSSYTQPITVGDILVAVHRMLQRQISHRDWVKLSQDEATAIARAYTRRCRTFPSAEQFEASQGVRRVDYLKDKFVFKGLSRTRGDDGFEHVKLLVGRKQ